MQMFYTTMITTIDNMYGGLYNRRSAEITLIIIFVLRFNTRQDSISHGHTLSRCNLIVSDSLKKQKSSALSLLF